MISNPVTGAGYLLKGWGLIIKPGVRAYVIVPLLINMLLFAGMIWLLADQFGAIIDWLTPSLPDWLLWLTWLLWLVFGLTAFVIIFFTFSVVANLVGAPFNGYLAAAVETHLTGIKPNGSDRGFTKEAAIAIMGELKKLLYFLLWAIPLLIASFIPVINLVTPALWIVFGAWMMSIEYADYPMGNHGLSFPEIRRKLSEKRVLSLGFGGAVMLATMIPIFNFLVMPVSVAGAAAMRVEQFDVKPAITQE